MNTKVYLVATQTLHCHTCGTDFVVKNSPNTIGHYVKQCADCWTHRDEVMDSRTELSAQTKYLADA